MNSGPWKTRRWSTADPHGSAHASVKMPSVPGSQCVGSSQSVVFSGTGSPDSQREHGFPTHWPSGVPVTFPLKRSLSLLPPSPTSAGKGTRRGAASSFATCLPALVLRSRLSQCGSGYGLWGRPHGWPGITVYQPWPVPTHVRFLGRCLNQHWKRASPGHFLTFERPSPRFKEGVRYRCPRPGPSDTHLPLHRG